MKNALINPTDLVDGKPIVVDVQDTQYETSTQYFWVPCDDTVQIHYLYDNGEFLPPPLPTVDESSNDEYIKDWAIRKLSYTDWVEIPSVGDINNTPHLVNKDEFIAYRNELRKIALNPSLFTGTMPPKPQEQWSN